MTALHWAAQKGDVELAKMLLYASANLKATTRIGGYTPLLIASKNGDAAMIETLTKAGADANAPDHQRHHAADAGRRGRQGRRGLDAARARRDVNAKESVKGETALTFAAAFGRADVIRVARQGRRRRQGDDQGGRPHRLRARRAGAARRRARPQPGRRRGRPAARPGAAAAARRRARRLAASRASTTTPSWSPSGAASRRCTSRRARARSTRSRR